MKHVLTAPQRQALATALHKRCADIQQQLRARQQGLSPAEQALASREQDGDDALQLASEREVQDTIDGLEDRELRALQAALERINQPDYGLCVQCGKGIPFGRLQVEPQALRCVVCEAQREKTAPG